MTKIYHNPQNEPPKHSQSPKKCGVKSIILAILVVGFSLWFWRSLFLAFQGGKGFSALILSAIVFFVFILLLNLFYFLVSSRMIVYLTLFLIAFSFLLVFPFNIYYLIVLVLFFLSLFYSYERTRKDKDNHIRISFFKSVSQGLSFTLTVIAILISVAFCFNFSFELPKKDTKISPMLMEPSKRPIERMISMVLPFYKEGMTTEEFFAVIAFKETKKKLPPEVIKNFEKQGIDIESADPIELLRENLELGKMLSGLGGLGGQQEEISSKLGIEIKPDEPLIGTVFEFIETKLPDFMGPYMKYIPLLLAFSLFSILRVLMIPFSWISLFASWILFKLLISLRIAEIRKDQKKVEVAGL